MNRQLLDKTVEDFTSKGFDASGYVVDVSSEEMVTKVLRKWKRPMARLIS